MHNHSFIGGLQFSYMAVDMGGRTHASICCKRPAADSPPWSPLVAAPYARLLQRACCPPSLPIPPTHPNNTRTHLATHLQHELGAVPRGAQLQHLLDDVVAKHVVHQRQRLGQQLMEGNGQLRLRQLPQVLLDEAAAVLVQAEVQHVAQHILGWHTAQGSSHRHEGMQRLDRGHPGCFHCRAGKAHQGRHVGHQQLATDKGAWCSHCVAC